MRTIQPLKSLKTDSHTQRGSAKHVIEDFDGTMRQETVSQENECWLSRSVLKVLSTMERHANLLEYQTALREAIDSV